MDAKLVTGALFRRALAARRDNASRPHQGRRSQHHGPAGGGFLGRATPRCNSVELGLYGESGFTANSPMAPGHRPLGRPAAAGRGHIREGNAMPDAFIYDHVRTPRGRGKVGRLAARSDRAQSRDARRSARSRSRNDLDPALVDDVVLGCVDPVGEAGGDIARAAALVAGYGDSVAGRADQPLLRVRPRRGEFRRRADHVRPARHGDRRRRRIDEPRRHRRLGRRLAGRSVDRGRATISCRRAFRPT